MKRVIRRPQTRGDKTPKPEQPKFDLPKIIAIIDKIVALNNSTKLVDPASLGVETTSPVGSEGYGGNWGPPIGGVTPPQIARGKEFAKGNTYAEKMLGLLMEFSAAGGAKYIENVVDKFKPKKELSAEQERAASNATKMLEDLEIQKTLLDNSRHDRSGGEVMFARYKLYQFIKDDVIPSVGPYKQVLQFLGALPKPTAKAPAPSTPWRFPSPATPSKVAQNGRNLPGMMNPTAGAVIKSRPASDFFTPATDFIGGGFASNEPEYDNSSVPAPDPLPQETPTQNQWYNQQQTPNPAYNVQMSGVEEDQTTKLLKAGLGLVTIYLIYRYLKS